MSYNDKVVHHIEPLLGLLWVSSDEEKPASKYKKDPLKGLDESFSLTWEYM